MSTEAFDRIAEVLREANKRYPKDAFVDRRRLSGLLADHIGDADSQIRVVMNAIQDGAAEQLVQAPAEELGLHINRLASKLERAWGLKPEIALLAIQACAYGVGRAPLPSASGSAMPPPAQDDWVGMSQVVTPGGGSSSAAQATGQTAAQTAAQTSVPAGTSLQDWFKANQKLVMGGAAAAVVALYFMGQKAPTPQPPDVPPTADPRQPGGQPQQPQGPAVPPGQNPNQPQRPGQSPPGQNPNQPQARQMAWYDDNNVKWDVNMGGSGEFIGRVTQNGAAFTMKGEIANNAVTFQIYDGKNQQVAVGGGIVQDARHLMLTTNDMSGKTVFTGKIHIDHPPGN